MPAVPMTEDEFLDACEAEETGRATPLEKCRRYPCSAAGDLRGVVRSKVVDRADATRVRLLTCGHWAV